MLSGPQRKFAEGVASGLNLTAAYAAAYPNAKKSSAMASTTRLLRNAEIKDEIVALRFDAAHKPDGPQLTLERKLKFLSAVVLKGDSDDSSPPFKLQDRLRALELHAKLSGELSDKLQLVAELEINVTIGG